MSSEKNGGRWRFQCDVCPGALDTNIRDFHEAFAMAKGEGWIAFQRDGMWFHKCNGCRGVQ